MSDQPKNLSRVEERRAIHAAPPARAAVSERAESGALDEPFARIDTGQVDLTGDGGSVPELIKAILERGRAAELTDQLGFEKGAPDTAAFPNSCNGSTPKTVGTGAGDVDLRVPQDRDGTFTPRLVPTGQQPARRAGRHHHHPPRRWRRCETSPITSKRRWEPSCRTRQSAASRRRVRGDPHLAGPSARRAHLVIYLDAIVVKVRDGVHMVNKAAYFTVGVDRDGIKHVLGIWLQQSEGAKFWAAGVRRPGQPWDPGDVLIVCCDGLTGLPEAVEATSAAASVQTCVVHLIRAAMRFVG